MNIITRVIRTFCLKKFNLIFPFLALPTALGHAVQQFKVTSFIIAFYRP